MITMQIRQSQARTYRRCKRKFKLGVIDKLISIKKSPALSIGSACHAGRAEWLRSRDANKALDSAMALIYSEIEMYPSLKQDELEVKRIVGEVVASYCEAFGRRFPGNSIKIFAVEIPFELKIAEVDELELFIAGTLDADAILVEKYRVNFEYKTTKKTLTQFFAEEYMSVQHTTYTFALESIIQESVYGTVLDVSRKPLQTKGPEHDHIIIPNTDDQLSEFKRDQIELLKEVRYSIDNDYFPPNTDSCFTRLGTCEYYTICRSNFDLHVIRNEFCVVDDLKQVLQGGTQDDL